MAVPERASRMRNGRGMGLVPHQLFLTNTFISGVALPLVPNAFGIRRSALASLSTPPGVGEPLPYNPSVPLEKLAVFRKN